MTKRQPPIAMTWDKLKEENPNLEAELDDLFPNDGQDTCRNYVRRRKQRRGSVAPIRYPRKCVLYDGVKRAVYAYRIAHIRQFGKIEEGHHVWHRCRDNPSCGYEGHLHSRVPVRLSSAADDGVSVEEALKFPDDTSDLGADARAAADKLAG